ncbi:MAG: ATP-binding protein [Acidobacteriota bacterium]
MSRRQLVPVLVTVLCVPMATVLWLGSRLLEQDRQLEAQRKLERREQAADRALRALASALSEEALFRTNPGEGALGVRLPQGPLLFRTSAEPLPEAPAAAFEEGERLEFRQGQSEGAAEVYRRTTRAANAVVRAGAWLRLARCQRKAGRVEEALLAYAELARMDGVAAGGWPASLAAMWGRCTLLEELNRETELRAEAKRLRAALVAGRWQLTRATYNAFAEDAARWTGEPRPALVEKLTEAADALWERIKSGGEAAAGRRCVTVRGTPVTLAWRVDRQGTQVFAASPAYIERLWLPRAGERVWLRDEAGRDFPAAKSEDFSLRYAEETGLPWTVAVAAPAAGAELATRRRLLLVLLGVVALFSLVGGYFILRALRKEFALARMQTDFVAAVSHEFRTPLTSLRQITEVLGEGRVRDDDRRQSYYRSLARATQRLHRLVEDLLDFRRMEGGAYEYEMRTLAADELVLSVTDEFRREVEDRGFRVAARIQQPGRVKADDAALGRALWNLLDNAVKYSGESRDIEVSLGRVDGQVSIAVADHGIGIRAEERGQLFAKFYRAAEAKKAGIKGTGIGLAMVAQVVAAHRGRVVVESEEGRGSTFTVLLPLVEG